MALWREALSAFMLALSDAPGLFLRPPGAMRILTPITNAGTETEEICTNTTGSNNVTASNFTPETALLHRTAYIITS